MSPSLAAAPAPSEARGLVLTELIDRLARSVMECARRYEVAAERAEGALRQALEALGRAKHAQAADLAPLARAARLPARPGESGPPTASPPMWGVILGDAFQAERVLERTARELGVLASDPPIQALAARLAAGAAEQRAEVRRLYLRYS